ncbi:MAG TPA: helix-turn-helix transcriptional regulator, partial [Candidatus Angelobacter sp.]|nr:helix-turn-helix transcriptional regulator [Candidatus Angelobacter sp.]
KDISPVWTRSFPIAKEPTTLGQHLKKRRFSAGMRQSEAAQQLRVSERTLSLWETDQVHPTRAFQPRLIAYLGYDPFNDPMLGSPKGNEPSGVAFLSSGAPANIGQVIVNYCIEMRKTRKQFAKEIGIHVRTIRNW